MSNKEDIILDVAGISKTYSTYLQSQSFWGSVKNFFYRKNLSVNALHPTSFQVRKGEFLGVLGPNGAGKTTTLKILTGLITPSEGHAQAFGAYDTSKRLPAYLRQIGMVMGQRAQLLTDLPALDSFYLSKALYEIEDSVFKKRLDEFVDMLNVGGKISVPVRKLSLGERMKMELILSMLHHPKILFLDEPTIGLDFHAAKVIRRFLLSMNKDFKMTILLTSHYSKDIEELCDRVLLINHGRLVYDGSLEGVDERIVGQRILDLKFKRVEDLQAFHEKVMPWLKEEFAGLGLGESETPLSLRLLLSTRDSQAVLSKITSLVPEGALADVLLGEQGIDEIFSQIYQNGSVV